MAKGDREGLLIAGGGLAGSLAALAMAKARPDVPILIVEEGESFGGQHMLTFLERDIDEADRWLADPLVSQRWPGYYLALPAHNRKLKTACAGIRPADIDRALRQALRPDQYRLGTKVVAVRDNELILQGGEKVRADGAIDARGAANLSMLGLRWARFLGRHYRLKAPHGLDRPVLIDAAEGGAQGARFARYIPLGEGEALIEEVEVAEAPSIDREQAGRRIEAHLALRGWAGAKLEGESAGARPLTTGGDFGAFWRVGGARVAKLGLRGGFFHPATGHSLPDALRTATLLTEQRDFTGGALHDFFEQVSASLWRKREFYRGFNARLFDASPDDRAALLDRFYRLEPGVLARFHAGQATMLDRRRIGRL